MDVPDQSCRPAHFLSDPFEFCSNQRFRVAILTNLDSTTNRFARKTLGDAQSSTTGGSHFDALALLTGPVSPGPDLTFATGPNLFARTVAPFSS
jgi:hypothetical protein